jgi:hypothetical protein
VLVPETFGEFVLFGNDQEQTRILLHNESHFAVSIPGKARGAASTSVRPSYGVLVRCQELPIEIGFRMDRAPHSGTASNPAALVASLATAYAADRATDSPRIAPVKRLPRGAAASVAALYTVRGGDDRAMEHLMVTTAAADTQWSLYQTTRFRTGEVSPIEWANFRTALMYYQSWIETEAPDVHPWPASEFAEASAKLTLTPPAFAEAQAKAKELGPLTADATRNLGELLVGFASHDDPPALPIGRATLEITGLRIAGTGLDRAAKVLLRNLDEVKTTYDYRAWCWQCIWAIGNRDAS